MLEDAHVEAARNALLQSNGKLNDWETSFLSSMLHIRWPSARQLTVLEELVWKAKAPKPRAKSGRGRKAGR